MPRLPVVSGRQVVAALRRAGFQAVDQEGSHVKMRCVKVGRTFTVIVPLHPELAPGTFRSILKQAGLTVEQLVQLL